MENQIKVGGHGIGFTGLLTIAFIVLKLCHQITWGWLWVLSPLWISAAVVLTAIALVFFFLGLAALWIRFVK